MQIKDVPAVIRDRIKEKGMTIKAVAEKASLTRQALSAMIRHKQKITATAFVGLCAVLDLRPENFIEKKGE